MIDDGVVFARPVFGTLDDTRKFLLEFGKQKKNASYSLLHCYTNKIYKGAFQSDSFIRRFCIRSLVVTASVKETFSVTLLYLQNTR